MGARVRALVGAVVKRKRPSPHKQLLADTRPHYDAMLEEQGGVCAICRNPPKTRKLDIDHDHRTMQVRGLLCHRCNRFLPPWITVEWLEAAKDYLTAPPGLVAPAETSDGETA